MKRTSSMICVPTWASRELYCYAINNGRLAAYLESVENILRKKCAKGVYNSEKCVDAFYPFMCEAAKMYARDFGGSFSICERFSAACEARESFECDELEA